MTLRDEVLKTAAERYGTAGETLFAKYPGFAVLRHPNRKWYGVVMDIGRDKLGIEGEGVVDVLNVKCDPLISGSLRQTPGIFPAYHMNKEKWVSVLLDGTVDMEMIASLLDTSYQLVGKRKAK